MSENLIRNLQLLELISKIRNRKLRQDVLKDQASKLYKAIKEISINLMKGNIQLSQRDKKRLYKYRREIVEIAENANSKRIAIVTSQTGGFLPIIIPLVAQLVTSLIDGARR